MGIRARRAVIFLNGPRSMSTLKDRKRRPSRHSWMCAACSSFAPACCCFTDCWNSKLIVARSLLRFVWSTTPSSGKPSRGPLGRFVAAACLLPASTDEAAVTEANASILASLPYKFANGLRYYALEPGERLHTAVFQPAIWERRRMLPRQVTPNTLLAFTDGKLVVIEEKQSSGWRRQPSQGEYGWIFTYIPLDRVVDMVVTPRERWVELRLRLEWGAANDERAFLLEPAVAAQLEDAWQPA